GPRKDVERGPQAPEQKPAILPDDRPAPVVVVMRAWAEVEVPDGERRHAAPDQQEGAPLPRRLEPHAAPGGQDCVKHGRGRASSLRVPGDLELWLLSEPLEVDLVIAPRVPDLHEGLIDRVAPLRVVLPHAHPVRLDRVELADD